MSYNLDRDRATETERLLADIATAMDGPGSWATRAAKVSDLLHAAGYHRADLDADGRLVTSSGHDCPRCSMHPERLPAEVAS